MHLRLNAILALSLTTVLTTVLPAQAPQLSPDVLKYVKVNAPAILLAHVRVIDGTGAAPLEDQYLLIENGKITSISGAPPANSAAQTIDLQGHTIIPGLVGMHDHLYYIARADEAADGSSAPPPPRRRSCRRLPRATPHRPPDVLQFPAHVPRRRSHHHPNRR